jgi:hypothetical protein
VTAAALVGFSMPPVSAAWLSGIRKIFIGIRVNIKVLRGGDFSSAHTSAKFLEASKLIGNIFWLFWLFHSRFLEKQTRQARYSGFATVGPAAPPDEIIVVHPRALSTKVAR